MAQAKQKSTSRRHKAAAYSGEEAVRLHDLLAQRREIIDSLNQPGADICDGDPRNKRWTQIERSIVGVPAKTAEEAAEALATVLQVYRADNDPEKYGGEAMDVSLLEAAIGYLKEADAARTGPLRILSDLETPLDDLLGLADALAVMCGGGNDLPTKPVRSIAYTIEHMLQEIEKKRRELIDALRAPEGTARAAT